MKPEDIENREFLVSMRGYARDEVDAFKSKVAHSTRTLQRQLQETQAQLSESQSQLAAATSKVASLTAQLAEARQTAEKVPAQQPERDVRPAPGTADPRSDAFRQVAQETEKILMAAEEVAEDLHERAMREAAGVVTDARLRAEKIFAEVENAKRAAEQDLERIRESRSMIASQMEDIGRRLAETVARLRVPVESPANRQGGRPRLQQDAPRQPVERQPLDRQALERQAAERQMVERQAAERYAIERQALERQAEERKLAERQAHQRQASERAAAERQAAMDRQVAERAASSPVAGPSVAGPSVAAPSVAAPPLAAPPVAEVQASAPETVESPAAVPPVPLPPPAEVPPAAVVPQAPQPQEAGAQDSTAPKPVDRPGVGSPAGDHKPAVAAAAVHPVAAPAPNSPPAVAAAARAGSQSTKHESAGRPAEGRGDPPNAPTESSSLSELLEEIRRTREKSQPAEEASSASASASASSASASAVAAVLAPELEDVPEPPDPMLGKRSAALGDLPLQASRRLKRLLQEDHNDLLDRLRTKRGKGSLDDNLAPLPDQFARFQTGLSEALTKAFAEGRRAAGGSGSADAAKAVSNLVARQVVNPLRAEVSRAVAGGLEAQDTPTSIAERASDVFRVWKGVRTELLGEGMVYAAFNQGLVDGWSRNPRIQKLWVTSEEEECPNDVCAKNVAAGPVALKSTFPSGHLNPPAHGGCTCTLKSV